MSLRQLFKRIIQPERAERPLHLIERRMAKEYIKKRLAALFPELRGDTQALERAYQELSLEAAGTVRRSDGNVASFSVRLPESVSNGFEQN